VNDTPRSTGSGSPDSDDDRLLRQVRAALAPLPSVDRRAIADIMTQVAARERAPRAPLARWWESVREWWQLGVPPVARSAALAAAALMVGFLARGAWSPGANAPTGDATAVAASATAAPAVASAPVAGGQAPTAMRATPLVPTEGAEGRVLPVPTQFVLDGRDLPPDATVSVVGDFNDWDVQAAPMTRENGVWSTTLPLVPGRHVYAFVVNSERWLADPRAPKAPDADFGRPGSVIIVRTP
jgi:hypothetical protein